MPVVFACFLLQFLFGCFSPCLGYCHKQVHFLLDKISRKRTRTSQPNDAGETPAFGEEKHSSKLTKKKKSKIFFWLFFLLSFVLSGFRPVNKLICTHRKKRESFLSLSPIVKRENKTKTQTHVVHPRASLSQLECHDDVTINCGSSLPDVKTALFFQFFAPWSFFKCFTTAGKDLWLE